MKPPARVVNPSTTHVSLLKPKDGPIVEGSFFQAYKTHDDAVGVVKFSV